MDCDTDVDSDIEIIIIDSDEEDEEIIVDISESSSEEETIPRPSPYVQGLPTTTIHPGGVEVPGHCCERSYRYCWLPDTAERTYRGMALHKGWGRT